MTVSFYTLGCKVNQYETEKIRALFEKEGFITVPFSEGADVCVINTCTVTSIADGKSRAVIRKAKHINPKTFVVVTGCYSQTHTKDVTALEECDLLVDIKEKYNIPSVIKKMFKYEPIFKAETTLRQRQRAVLKVQDGCNQFCSYCLIPFARNTLYSEPIEKVIEEVQSLCENNYKEIILTGIRLGSYNYKGNNICDLIKSILDKTNIEKIRLSSIEMWEITEELSELLKSPRLCNHLHIPLQHGTNEILKLMNRPYTAEQYMDLVNKIRAKIPNIGLTSDVIAGFPQETDELFRKSCEFITKVGFSRIHVFKYSRRPLTVADKMEGHIEPVVKKERVDILTNLGNNLARTFGEKHINKECEMIFVQKKKDGFLYGYTDNYLEVKTHLPLPKNQYIKLKPTKVDESGVLIIQNK